MDNKIIVLNFRKRSGHKILIGVYDSYEKAFTAFKRLKLDGLSVNTGEGFIFTVMTPNKTYDAVANDIVAQIKARKRIEEAK